MHNVQIFDVDGTLTYSKKDRPDITVYDTFSFWPLISYKLCKNKSLLEQAIVEWEYSMKSEPDPDQSSFDMMQRTITDFFPTSVAGRDITIYAEAMTRSFIKHGIIQLKAINYLQYCLDQGIICILTTGSYLDGLQGFINTLVNENILSKTDNLYLNGAEFDWESRVLMHANIGEHKVSKLQQTLSGIQYDIQAAFGDDPYINDRGILEYALKKQAKVFVIKSQINLSKPFNTGFLHCTWEEYLSHYKVC